MYFETNNMLTVLPAGIDCASAAGTGAFDQELDSPQYPLEKDPEKLTGTEMQKKIQRVWTGEIQLQASLASYTSLGVGGPVSAIIEPNSAEDVAKLLKGFSQAGIPWFVIGRGSNLLISDNGIEGVAIVFGKKYAQIEYWHDHDTGSVIYVKAGAGCGLGRLVNWCCDQGIAGMEFASGIPGTVGGAVAMNAGAWGKEIGDVLEEVEVVSDSGHISRKTKEDLHFGYRQLSGIQNAIILQVVFALHADVAENIVSRIKCIQEQRKNTQPTGQASAGSFFKNPPGAAAGKLIEDTGLKGMRIGGAMVSDRHANFLINTGNASADDFFRLMQFIQAEVKRKFGVALEPEVKLLGFTEEI